MIQSPVTKIPTGMSSCQLNTVIPQRWQTGVNSDCICSRSSYKHKCSQNYRHYLIVNTPQSSTHNKAQKMDSNTPGSFHD